MVMSILFQDRGTISVLGKASALESKDRIGYLPEERGLYRKMRVGAFLKHIGRLKGLPGHTLTARVKQWLERVGLADCFRKKCEELSKGMQQKVQIIAALIHDPELVILDEPFSGLDPVNSRLLRDLILDEHRAGRTVIFSTHVMHQAETMCDRIVMINRGRKVLDDTVTAIRSRSGPRSILYEPLGPDGAGGAADSDIRGIRGVRDILRTENGREVFFEAGADPTAIMRRIVETIPVARIEVRRPNLEDIFIDIVTGPAGGGVGGGAGAGGDAPSEHDLRAAVRDEPVALEARP
jgi:ABC-2 type transport system ATP-binding protein